MRETRSTPYRAQQFALSGLNGISDKTLEMHFKLYEGYVNEANTLTEQISEYLRDGKIDQDEMPAYSELKRRLGFEYNGMVLHEYYFGNLTGNGGGDPERRSAFRQATEASFGGYEKWKTDFVGVGKMRGVGWAICYYDRATGRLSNHWTTLHEMGNVAGFEPIIVMDVWEHAFLLDTNRRSDRSISKRFFQPPLEGDQRPDTSHRRELGRAVSDCLMMSAADCLTRRKRPRVNGGA